MTAHGLHIICQITISQIKKVSLNAHRKSHDSTVDALSSFRQRSGESRRMAGRSVAHRCISRQLLIRRFPAPGAKDAAETWLLYTWRSCLGGLSSRACGNRACSKNACLGYYDSRSTPNSRHGGNHAGCGTEVDHVGGLHEEHRRIF